MIANVVTVNGDETGNGRDTCVAKLVEYYEKHS